MSHRTKYGLPLGDRLSIKAIVACALGLTLFVLLVSLLSGCASIRPQEVNRNAPSWDQGQQNSGFIGYVQDKGGDITPDWRDRYNGYIGKYAAYFTPPLVPDQGILRDSKGALVIQPNGHYWADHDARVHMFIMSKWAHSGMHAPASVLQQYTSKGGT